MIKYARLKLEFCFSLFLIKGLLKRLLSGRIMTYKCIAMK